MDIIIIKTFIAFFILQISLSDVPGTGKEGRILKEDIMQYIEGMKAKTTPGNY